MAQNMIAQNPGAGASTIGCNVIVAMGRVVLNLLKDLANKEPGVTKNIGH